MAKESGLCAVTEGDRLRAVAEEVFLELIGPPTKIIIYNLILSLIFSHLLPCFNLCW